jgi:hypothetical protein
MAEIVTAFSSSHAPMMAADPGSAPPDQAERFFGALEKVHEQAKAAAPQAVVMLSGEHFTNYFLDALPQVAVGLADRYRFRRPGG